MPHVLAVRIDESLVFTNASYLEMYLLNTIADQPDVTDIVLIFSAVNFVDASALESLECLIDELRGSGVTLHLAEVKGPISDRLARVGFAAHLEPGRIFLSTHDAVIALAGRSSPDPSMLEEQAGPSDRPLYPKTCVIRCQP